MPIVKPRDPIIYFASNDVPEAIDEAKAYIKREGHTQDKVRIVRREGMILVEQKL